MTGGRARAARLAGRASEGRETREAHQSAAARPTGRRVTLVERAAAEEEEARKEEEPAGDSTALCGEGGSVL